MYSITYRWQTKLMFNVETQLTLSSLLMIVNKARKLGIGGPWIQSNQDSRRQGGMEFMEYVDDTNLRTSLLIPSNRTKKMSAWQWPVIPDHVGCNNLDDHTVVRSQQRHAGRPLLQLKFWMKLNKSISPSILTLTASSRRDRDTAEERATARRALA